MHLQTFYQNGKTGFKKGRYNIGNVVKTTSTSTLNTLVESIYALNNQPVSVCVTVSAPCRV